MKSVDLFPTEYVMIDTETTGFSSTYDSMLEISAVMLIVAYVYAIYTLTKD